MLKIVCIPIAHNPVNKNTALTKSISIQVRDSVSQLLAYKIKYNSTHITWVLLLWDKENDMFDETQMIHKEDDAA